MPTYVPAMTGKKTDASADLTPPKKAAPADGNVAGGGMGAANLSHSTATFATIRNRMRRLQNTRAGLQGPASLSIGRNHLFHSAVTPATLRPHKPRTSGTV